MSFPRYPEYKDSGVEWLGDVPGHWGVWKLAHAFAQIGSGTTPKTDNREYYEGGHIPWVNTGDLNDGELDECEKRITALAIVDHSSLKTYPAGSLLIAMYGATIGKLAILNFAATVNQACCVFAGKSEIASKFMFYWFLGLRQQIISLATGGGQPNISQDILRSLRVACPPLPEQTQIAAFLDRETAKIDALVAEQWRLMALLKEKRQAVISHAVTRGLTPHSPMKQSGIEWLGDVPEHWDVTKIKRLVATFEQGWSPQCEGFPVETDQEWGVLKVGCVNGGTFKPEENKTLPPELAPIPSLGIAKGDLLISRANTRELVGGAAVAKQDHTNLLLCDKLYRLRFSPTVCSPVFIAMYLGTGMARGQIELAATGASSSMVNISQSTILELELALPGFQEQQTIVAFLEAESTKFDTLTAEAQRAIDLLQERRTALISAAVTGQIDVRGAL
jgi:type I restriction enzyme, S subunit